jgi:hypothetical protein
MSAQINTKNTTKNTTKDTIKDTIKDTKNTTKDITETIWKDSGFNELHNLDDSGDLEIFNMKPKVCLCEEENYDDNFTCMSCGLVNMEYSVNVVNNVYEKQEDYRATKSCGVSSKSGFSKLSKMQKWFDWTNKEKNEYKLVTYTRELCVKLGIQENLIKQVCETVCKIMNGIRDSNDGPKRSRVKDGIIIVSIHYTLKSNGIYNSYNSMSKKLNLETKYISKADKIINELIHSKKVQFSEDFLECITKTMSPSDYLKEIFVIVSEKDSIDIQKLINICEDNDILGDNNPLSIGMACLYYIIQKNNINLDIHKLCDKFDISIITLMKTASKLLVYKESIDKLLDV